jgi:hypothetical protein
VEKATPDFYKLGLAAFADHNFHKAGDLFSQAGQDSEKQRKVVDAKRADLLQEAIRNYEKSGDARYSDYAFADALASYQKALRAARATGSTFNPSRAESPWGGAMRRRGHLSAGPCLLEGGAPHRFSLIIMDGLRIPYWRLQ